MKAGTFVGNLRSGEAVFQSFNGGLAVEKEYRYLVEPTLEETAEIYKTMSHLRPAKEAKS